MKRTSVKINYYVSDEGSPYQVYWLCSVLNEHNMTARKLGPAIYRSGQSIYNWMAMKSIMTFGDICAICFVLSLNDNPVEVYEKIIKERNDD